MLKKILFYIATIMIFTSTFLPAFIVHGVSISFFDISSWAVVISILIIAVLSFLQYKNNYSLIWILSLFIPSMSLILLIRMEDTLSNGREIDGIAYQFIIIAFLILLISTTISIMIEIYKCIRFYFLKKLEDRVCLFYLLAVVVTLVALTTAYFIGYDKYTYGEDGKLLSYTFSTVFLSLVVVSIAQISKNMRNRESRLKLYSLTLIVISSMSALANIGS